MSVRDHREKRPKEHDSREPQRSEATRDRDDRKRDKKPPSNPALPGMEDWIALCQNREAQLPDSGDVLTCENPTRDALITVLQTADDERGPLVFATCNLGGTPQRNSEGQLTNEPAWYLNVPDKGQSSVQAPDQNGVQPNTPRGLKCIVTGQSKGELLRRLAKLPDGEEIHVYGFKVNRRSKEGKSLTGYLVYRGADGQPEPHTAAQQHNA